MERETRALLAASREIADAGLLLLTLDATPPARALPEPIIWRPAAAWLLDPGKQEKTRRHG